MPWNLVLVQLGPSKPRHLFANLSHLIDLFPTVQIVVVYDDAKLQKRISRDFPQIELFKFDGSQNEGIWSQSRLNFQFRKGFWRYSTERLLALEQVHELRPGHGLLHIESDILLFPNFPFESVTSGNTLAWQTVSESHDVAAVMFSPSLAHTEVFSNKIREKLADNPYLNDMTLLSQIRIENPSLLTTLPSWNSDWGMPIAASARDYALITDEYSAYEGIFDGSTIGVWLTGQDRRNNGGRLVLHSDFPGSLTDTSLLSFRIDSNGNLWAKAQGMESPIFCLHVHSKNIKLFRDGYRKELGAFCELSSTKDRIALGFSPSAFWQWLKPILPAFLHLSNYVRFGKRIFNQQRGRI